MNSCIHRCTTGQAYFYSTIFEKGLAQQRFLGVAYLPIIFTSVPGHSDKSTPLNRGCILQLILEPGI